MPPVFRVKEFSSPTLEVYTIPSQLQDFPSSLSGKESELNHQLGSLIPELRGGIKESFYFIHVQKVRLLIVKRGKTHRCADSGCRHTTIQGVQGESLHRVEWVYLAQDLSERFLEIKGLDNIPL